MSTIAPSIPSLGDDLSGGGGDMLWVLHAPCACITGWCVTSLPGHGPLLDEDSVWEVFFYGPVRQRRMRAEGWKFLWEPEDAVYAGMESDCPHTPRYWSSVLIVPDGYEWAARTKSSTVEHLVRDWQENLLRDEPGHHISDGVAPLCSTEPTGPWWMVARADPCPACEEAAARLGTPDDPPGMVNR